MRHYMVDPDNEERLLKIPPRVVATIQSEILNEAREIVYIYSDRNGISAFDRWLETRLDGH